MHTLCLQTEPIKENRRMSTCNRLDLQTLGSPPVMHKNLLDHCVWGWGQGSGRTGSSLQKNRLSLRNNRLKFETSGEIPIILEESIEYASIEWKQNRKMWTCNRLDLQTLGSQPVIMPKKLLGHWPRLNQNYDRGEPAVSYKWTGWVWEITGWSSRLQENYRSF